MTTNASDADGNNPSRGTFFDLPSNFERLFTAVKNGLSITSNSEVLRFIADISGYKPATLKKYFYKMDEPSRRAEDKFSTVLSDFESHFTSHLSQYREEKKKKRDERQKIYNNLKKKERDYYRQTYINDRQVLMKMGKVPPLEVNAPNDIEHYFEWPEKKRFEKENTYLELITSKNLNDDRCCLFFNEIIDFMNILPDGLLTDLINETDYTISRAPEDQRGDDGKPLLKIVASCLVSFCNRHGDNIASYEEMSQEIPRRYTALAQYLKEGMSDESWWCSSAY